jgi:hypothetical protein
VQVGMPKIPQHVLKSTFFLYRTADEAERAENAAGTGFIVLLQLASDLRAYLTLGVTNWHVAVGAGASVVRVNRRDGSADIFDFDPSEWVFTPKGDDVCYVTLSIDPEVHDATAIPFNLFVTEELLAQKQIGVGDDTFMFGLYVDSRDHATGVPSARFGNISMMSNVQRQVTGCMNPSLVVDMHSRSGFSGSPVFVYRTIGANLDHANSSDMIVNEGSFFAFLGIHWGQFKEEWKVHGTSAEPERSVSGMSGLTMVIPAWRLGSMIRGDAKLKQALEEKSSSLGFDSSPQPEADTDRNVEKRRDAGLARALNTPPAPRSSDRK